MKEILYILNGQICSVGKVHQQARAKGKACYWQLRLLKLSDKPIHTPIGMVSKTIYP